MTLKSKQLEEGSSYLTLSVVGKGGKVRSVPFVPELKELLNEDRKAIREYIAEDNPSATLELDEQLEFKAGRLLSYPDLGRPGRIQGTRKLVAHTNYILIYDVAGNVVRVLRVLHAARQWPPA